MASFLSPPSSPLPTVDTTPGPDWASQLNSSVTELQSIVTELITVPHFLVHAPNGLDDTAGIQAALLAAAGKTLVFAPGSYVFTSTLAVPANTTLQLIAGATLTCKVTGGAAGITLGNAARLVGASYGSGNLYQVIAHASCNISSLVTNVDHTGGQEFCYIENLFALAQTGAVVAVALIDFVGLFVNSYVRDCVLSCNNAAPTGLRIRGGTSTGMGPVVVDNVWVTLGTSHNIIVTEANPSVGSCTGIRLHRITSENQASGAHGLFLQGFGGVACVSIRDYHYEHGSAVVATTSGIHADFVTGIEIDTAEFINTPIANKKGINLVNCYRTQVRNVYNLSSVTPVLDDTQNAVTMGSTNIGFYETARADANGPVQQFRHRVLFSDSLTVKTKAGAPVDGDFQSTPPDGTVAVDTTNSRWYVRIGGTWKSVVVA
jgi:hypothetical protein